MFERLRRGAEIVGALIFALMFGAFLLQVFMRYVLNRPLGWTDELSVIAYIWAIFWGCAFMVRAKDHVAFDLVYAMAGERARRLMALPAAGLVLALFAAALPATWDYVTFMRRERTPVLGLRFDLVYACFVIFIAATVIGALIRLGRLAGPRWRQWL